MPDVHHDPAAHTFSADVEGGAAELEYQHTGDTVTFVHTFVPEPARGGNVGSSLVEAGLAWARENDYTVVPQCPFVASYMDGHPETQDLLA
ncbi:GNAT family N-acetyltransferase [Rubrivirga sp. S365]|uniref:GNAT family N-acetyltransferase n=1 Tax=Rubrivirga litoralis TaxID=3075598 RepID=A0ABU3BUL1_9BACT|nr:MULTISPECIES: GNAT family N-acetyltransferase [unclassified Rubrivirga]MDT0632983.1 GNAT family N-acetyltransferase [Rubrivirga sp. F394]MDT7857889.1 GNAT family N-acetyltransferase [Rubrivirga sp. S365]